jgi:1-acyl-sn-glycerol-3-phosphate acyltransferase
VIKKRPLPLSILLCGVGYTIYFSGVVGFVILTIPLSLVLFPFGKPRELFRKIMENSLSALVTLLLPLLKVARIIEVEGLDEINESSGGIVIGNHRGWLDGPLLLGHLHGILPLMKSSYATNPLYKMFTRWFNFISLDASTQVGLKAAKDDCINQLNSGDKLLVFPEGTRSRSNKLLPFKKLAFLLAVETKSPIFPIIIHSNIPFMTKSLSSFFPKAEIKYRLISLGKVVPQENETAEKLLTRCEKMMAKRWREIDGEFGEK